MNVEIRLTKRELRAESGEGDEKMRFKREQFFIKGDNRKFLAFIVFQHALSHKSTLTTEILC